MSDEDDLFKATKRKKTVQKKQKPKPKLFEDDDVTDIFASTDDPLDIFQKKKPTKTTTDDLIDNIDKNLMKENKIGHSGPTGMPNWDDLFNDDLDLFAPKKTNVIKKQHANVEKQDIEQSYEDLFSATEQLSLHDNSINELQEDESVRHNQQVNLKADHNHHHESKASIDLSTDKLAEDLQIDNSETGELGATVENAKLDEKIDDSVISSLLCKENEIDSDPNSILNQIQTITNDLTCTTLKKDTNKAVDMSWHALLAEDDSDIFIPKKNAKTVVQNTSNESENLFDSLDCTLSPKFEDDNLECDDLFGANSKKCNKESDYKLSVNIENINRTHTSDKESTNINSPTVKTAGTENMTQAIQDCDNIRTEKDILNWEKNVKNIYQAEAPGRKIKQNDGEILENASTKKVLPEKCCKCDMMTLPVGDMVKNQVLAERSEKLALEQLVSVLEQEGNQLRDEKSDLQKQLAESQETAFDLKAQVKQEEKTAEEYKKKCEETQEQLLGTQRMIRVLEEQLSVANNYKSGVDSMLESKISQGRVAAAEARAEAAQTEVLQHQHEVKRLLDTIAALNTSKREMVSLDVHQELLKIAEEKSREAEIKVRCLEQENLELKTKINSLQNDLKVDLPGEKLGSWNQELLAKTLESTSQIINYPMKFSDDYYKNEDTILKSINTDQQTLAHANKWSHNQDNRQQMNKSRSSIIKKTGIGIALPGLTPKDQVVRDSDDSDSDWSSDDKEDLKQKPNIPSKLKSFENLKSPEAQIQKVKASLQHIVPTGKPTIAKKPSLPAKPKIAAKPTKKQSLVVEGRDMTIDFNQAPCSAALATIRRVKGPAGRRVPTVK